MADKNRVFLQMCLVVKAAVESCIWRKRDGVQIIAGRARLVLKHSNTPIEKVSKSEHLQRLKAAQLNRVLLFSL